MRKIKMILISIVSIFIFSINAFAASCSLSVSTEKVEVGDNFTVTAYMSSAASWNIHVSASGPVSDCTIKQADTTADALDTNKTFSATCKATGEGTITVTLSGDVTSASEDNAVQISGSKNVTVSKKAEPQPTEPTEPTKPTQPTQPTQPTTNNNDNKSKNNNLKTITIEGYDLVKVDNHNYTLTVPNNVTSINVKATAEDSKSKITGTGKHNINIGENNIEIVVTAENGSQNKIKIKVTRKENYNIDDLDSILKNDKNDNINITIEPTTKISAADLEKMKKSKKTYNLNVYNSNKVLQYSWIIDGTQLTDTNDFLTTISNDSTNKQEILKLANYADGLLIGLEQAEKLPNSAKIKIFVGNKYKDADLVNIYGYTKNNSELELIKDDVKVEKGYIEFEVQDANDYFVTMSTISNSDEVLTTTTTGETSSPSNSKLKIIIGVLSFLVLILLILLIILFTKNSKNKKKKKIINNATPTNNETKPNNNDIPLNTSTNTNNISPNLSQTNIPINNTTNNQSQVNNSPTAQEPWFK